ncbi:MAG: hypothetical protein M0Z69_03230 [Actinomycetota bacterium]|nr:hypothetical protein [Actinomycetota bacterium]
MTPGWRLLRRAPPRVRWRVRGIATQSLFCGVLLLAGNLRRLNAHREMVKAEGAPRSAERARRRRTSLSDFRPSG